MDCVERSGVRWMKIQAMIRLVFQVIVVVGPGVVVLPDPRKVQGAWWSMEVEHQQIALLICVE